MSDDPARVEVDSAVGDVLLEVVRQKRPEAPPPAPTALLTADLGIDSLDFAQVVAMLEERLGVDPFASAVSPTGIRVVQDLLNAYYKVCPR